MSWVLKICPAGSLLVGQLCPFNSLSLSLPIRKGQIYFSISTMSETISFWPSFHPRCGQAPSLVTSRLQSASLIFMCRCTMMSSVSARPWSSQVRSAVISQAIKKASGTAEKWLQNVDVWINLSFLGLGVFLQNSFVIFPLCPSFLCSCPSRVLGETFSLLGKKKLWHKFNGYPFCLPVGQKAGMYHSMC